MNQKRIISTAAVFLLMGTALPSFAQRDEGNKGEGGGRGGQTQHQSQPQHSQQSQRQAQPERTQQTQRQAQPQRVQQTQRHAQPERTQQSLRQTQPDRTQQTQRQPLQQRTQQGYGRQNVQTSSYSRGGGGGKYGRISNASYGSHFGHDHSFRMGRPQFIEGYNRFQYGGYWFGYNQAWPMGWDYDDDVYVVYEDGGYYMYNMRHPGIHFSINIF